MPKPCTLALILPVLFVPSPTSCQDSRVDRFILDYARYYGFRVNSCEADVYVYNLRGKQLAWEKTLPSLSSEEPGSTTIHVWPSDYSSSGGLVIGPGPLPSTAITRVYLWWPNRPTTMMDTSAFVSRMLGPSIAENDYSFLWRVVDRKPDNDRLYEAARREGCGKRFLSYQDIATDEDLLQKIRARYPDKDGPWGVHIEAQYLNLGFNVY